MARFFSKKAPETEGQHSEKERPVKKSHLGILDADTDEVPGSVILLSSVHKRNEPLGLQHAHARTSASSLPSPYGPAPRSASAGSRSSARSRRHRQPEKKRTKDGKFILDPQPEDSANDPLNWKQLRRDAALISLGLYCMVGGGMTPVLAAGFNNVAKTFDVTVPQVALTTGLYMLGLGLGSVVASPTAILWGKRPDDMGPASVPMTPTSPMSPVDHPTRPLRAHRVGFAVDSEQHPESSAAAAKGSSENHDYFGTIPDTISPDEASTHTPVPSAIKRDLEKQQPHPDIDLEHPATESYTDPDHVSMVSSIHYTDFYREAPQKSYVQSLKPWNGRLVKDKWHKVMLRPFILLAYPAVLWSSMVYALAVGWLIILSESMAEIYQNHESYNFTPLQVGLVYVSPFVGGVLGTAVAGKISDVVVRYMARRNDGVYEPEFRLVMAIPITISTVIGLMGFGWSAEEKDNWIVPTVFFGVISFGCSLGSTTSVTFVVDSYRQYAGEALVTLNFCKNILHGFIFSLFFTHWLAASGPKDTFIAVGGIQLGCMFLSIPMYMYGKRARMWTVRKNFMEKF
ncbi:uncharacterized protein N0V89_002025 [Didymosphaeria variabile]|uniref:MFS general substrate transporter n=1 Tax=Didymosphaeria variabile TaxID=1932322 RepID=A0A9W8XTP0_9PLEO|nr:uncharacterized protein N0V89_002025 [Didymosphaeria variabile]KAJ4357450.1 hypothetical protein N0V89_002025 [Didymosphaeria variabile]